MVCESVSYKCHLCIWSVLIVNESVPCITTKTYRDLAHADTPEKLLTACRNRAKYIKRMLRKYETKTRVS